MGVTVLVFVARLQKVRTTCISSDFLRGQVSKWHECGRGKEALKNPFFQNLHQDITVMTQCDKYGSLNENQREIAQVKCPLLRFSMGKSNSATTATENSNSVSLQSTSF